jgi:outer membrane lipoprotein-sorting protein
MKSRQSPNPAPTRALAAFALAVLTLPLSGCFLSTHTRAVRKVTVIPNVKTATLDQLLDQISKDYTNTKTITATVEITASSGGQHQGEVKEIPTFAGYIVLRKPADLHIQMLLPVVRSRALEMVSDGANFKLYIPPKNRAAVGKDEPTSSSPKGFENLRPYIIRDAMLIPPMQPDEQVALVEDSRIIDPQPGQKNALEEPDYDLIIFHHKQAQQLALVRVIHIGRATLRPYEQDIYDDSGHVVTKVTYNKFQKFGDTTYAQTILITRPIDEYALKIEFNKITFNLPVDDDSFLLNIPADVPIQKMDSTPTPPSPNARQSRR